MQTLFDELIALRDAKRLPPVTQWQPTQDGVIDIRIAQDGSWWHEGERIARQPMVDLFATILRHDEAGYALVTPQQRLSIEVEDVPFIAIRLEVDAGGDAQAQRLLFSTNVGDHVIASADHPIEIRNDRPYVLIRDGLYARLSRPVYYQLVELGAVENERLLVFSKGERFDLGSVV